MPASCSYLRVCALLLLAVVFVAPADARTKKSKYAPPAGFAGHLWGELRTSPGFAQLPEKPLGVGAAWTQAVMTDVRFTCMPPSAVAISMGGSLGGCDPYATLNTLRARFEGGGFYVLSEYAIEEQGARFGSEQDGVVLYPVIYQFCANWNNSPRTEVPPNFDEMNRFCGMRLHFRSESLEELRDLPADHATKYDLVLEKLIATHGKPDAFVHRGRVLIETPDGESDDRPERKFRVWRWCPAYDRGLHTRCSASVVLSFDPVIGVATILYSTPMLWEYAFARENNGFKGDKLFKMLHARKR
jgi:hypothetical protein